MKKNQVEKWERFKLLADRLHLSMKAQNLLAQNVTVAVNFARLHGVETSYNFEKLEKKRYQLQKLSDRMQRLIIDVESEKLGLRFHDGDFDILAPAHTPKEELQSYREFGWILITIGAVIVIGTLAHALLVIDENEVLRRDYNKLLEETNEKFCENPESSLCKSWLNKKEQSGFYKRESTVEKIQTAVSEIGTKIKKGAGIGMAIAIPLAVFLIARSFR